MSMNPTKFDSMYNFFLRFGAMLLCMSVVMHLHAQVNVNMPFNTGPTTYSISPPATCSFNFYDDGGPLGNYSGMSNPAQSVVTFAPSNPAYKIRVIFQEFGVDPFFDALYAYDGPNGAAPQISSGNPGIFVSKPGGFWGAIPPNNIAANTIQATGANASGALTFQFESDPTPNPPAYPGWVASVVELNVGACQLQAPAAVSVNAPSSGCTADILTTLPTYAPGGCNVNYALRYRINGGQYNNLAAFPATLTILDVPIGVNIITWELYNPCGGAVMSAVNQIITVKDVTPPSLSCPNNVTINLTSGACGQQYIYSPVTAVDNCFFYGDTLKLSHPGLTNVNNFAGGITFDVRNDGAEPISITGFTAAIAPGLHNVVVYLASSSPSAVPVMNSPLAWGLIGSVNVNSTAVGFFDETDVPIGTIVVEPGQSKGIYIATTDGPFLRYTNGNATSTDGTLTIISNGHGAGAYPFMNNNAPRTFVGSVKYIEPTTIGIVTQIAGLPSGAAFPIGTTTNIFQATDQAGNTGTCSFTVKVNEFVPIGGTSLSCNDIIQIALGANCYGTLTSDEVLDGDNYGCYDQYIVEVDKIPPFGNGPWVPAVFGPADIGKTYGVKVTNPVDWNYCNAQVLILDNLEPDLVCSAPVVDIPCNQSTAPTVSNTVSLTKSYNASGIPKNVFDFQTIEFDIPVNEPAGMTIIDVDFRLRISGDPFNLNLNAVLESPNGTIVTVWDQFSGCAPATLWVRFDDEGISSTACANLTTNKNLQVPAAIGQQLSAFDGEPVTGTWKLRVTDLDGFGDQSTVETAELIVTSTNSYTAGFPNGLTWPNPNITQVNANTFVVAAPRIDHCSNVTLTFFDQMMPQDCQSGFTTFVTRTWTARDVSSNIETCVQTIRLIRPDLDDVVLPPNYDDLDEPSLVCGTAYPTPDVLVSKGLQGYPLIFGQKNGCNINSSFQDDVSKTCDGTYTVFRRWTIDSDCQSGQLEYTQTIRVTDKQGPTLDCPADLTISTTSFSCCAAVNLPDLLITDACSRINNLHAKVYTYDASSGQQGNVYTYYGTLQNYPGNNPNFPPDTLGVFGNTDCLPVGTHIVVYEAQDACGNTATCSFNLTIVDFAPPSAACDQFTVVSIGVDDPYDCYDPSASGCEFGGVSWVKAFSFDDGSFDNCSSVLFRVRRTAPYSDCINSLSKLSCNGNPSEFEVATEEGDSIKFYCCEVGTTQSVILRVYQLDPSGDISLNPDGSPIFNECEVEVSVQDKIAPACQAPPNLTVSCENFDPTFWAHGLPTVEDNCCLDCSYEYQGKKGITHSANYASFDTVCSKGTIFRTFQVYDCHGLTRKCTQRIVVNYEQDYFIKFPDDVVVTFCDSTGMYGEPEFFGEDCELLATSYTDEVFTVVPDVCLKVERTWTVLNWCAYSPNTGCVNVPNPNPNSSLNHVSNLPGPTVSAPGTTGQWAPTVVKVNPTDQATTNYSTFWNPNGNCYKYKQIIKIVDNVAPFFEDCPAAPVEICDITENDPQLWNANYWFDPLNSVNNLCEAPVDLSITAGDACSGSNVNVKYLLFLDLDANGSMETVVSSTNPPAAGTVNYNNAGTPNFTGGTVRNFDQRGLPVFAQYRFDVQTLVVGNKVVASMRWNVPGALNDYSIPQLPHGTHKIKWIVEDGCGNEKVCEYTFNVKDCKVPSVLCLNGLATNIGLPMGAMVALPDLLEFAVDNCTPTNQLVYSMRKTGSGTGFPLDANGNPVEMLTYFCNELGTNLIEIWAKDKAGNASYCQTYLLVQDNPGSNGTICNPGSSATVAGMLGTELDFGVEDGHVEIAGQNPAGPSFDLNEMTDPNGLYHFTNAIPLYSNYTITPTKDDNPLNGVSTYDLVLISKHILGLDPLDSPYKMIAADANKSGSITTFDIVELRKLILGIYTELPNNTSWRFIDADFAFPNNDNPFESLFPESKSLASVQQSMMDDDFVAIKVGDVNATVIANTLMQADERSGGELLMDVADQPVISGETVTVWFTPSEQTTAYQMTLQFDGLEVVEVLPGNGMEQSNFAVFAPRPEFSEPAALTASVNGNQAPFGIRLRATRPGTLSQMITASSRITRAEAYNEQGEALNVALRFLKDGESVISGVGFELYQNQPNPFINKTMIGFHLPEAGEAILRVFDETGQVLHKERGDFAKGYNTFLIDRSSLPGNGVYFYQVESVDAFATRKMIQTN